MDTKWFVINDDVEQIAKLQAAAKIIKQGGLVAFPTETVYGLGANGLDSEAAAGIYLAKGRPSDNPLILHVANIAMVESLTSSLSDVAYKLMEAFWPGPMTLILPRSEIVPDQITGGLNTVGIRMPNHPIARQLIELSGLPIAAPSANTSGRPSPTTAQAVKADLAGKIDAIIDGGSCCYGVESTIIDCTSPVLTVLRPGAVTMEMLAEVVGDVQLDPALVGKSEVPKAPGMKYRHYAPKAPLILFTGADENLSSGILKEVQKAQVDGKKVGVIVSEETAAVLPDHIEKVVYGKRTDLLAIAAALYSALRHFDDCNIDIIFAEGTEDNGIGLAIMNRLDKACGHRIIRL